MKKLVAFLVLLTFLVSCTVIHTYEIYQKSYSIKQKTVSEKDVYSKLRTYDSDSIPLSSWLTLQANNDNGYLLQKTLTKKRTADTELRFVYSTFVNVNPDTVFYTLQIYCRTKNKNLQKGYKK